MRGGGQGRLFSSYEFPPLLRIILLVIPETNVMSGCGYVCECV